MHTLSVEPCDPARPIALDSSGSGTELLEISIVHRKNSIRSPPGAFGSLADRLQFPSSLVEDLASVLESRC